MTLKNPKKHESSGAYNPEVAFETIQENLKRILASEKRAVTYENGFHNEVYYQEEADRLQYLREQGKLHRKDRRTFGEKRKLINQFFQDRQTTINESKRGGSALALKPLSDLDSML